MNLNILRKITHFSELNDEQLKKIYSFCSIKRFDKNDIIFFETEPYKGFYAVMTGHIKVFKVSPDGKEQIINIFEPFMTFAEVPMFNGIKSGSKNQEYPANASSKIRNILQMHHPWKMIQRFYLFLQMNILNF